MKGILKRTLKLLVYTIIITIISYGVFSIVVKDDKIVNLNKENSKLETNLENAKTVIRRQKHIEKTNEHYNDLIKDIVKSIASRDKQYGVGGFDASSPGYTNSEALSAILKDIDNRAPKKWINNVGKFFEDRKEYFKDVPDIWPIKRRDLGRITSGFGVRVSPITNRYHKHNGIDITADRGTEVIATADAKVIGVWKHHPTFGKIVYLEHENKFETRYAHLSRINVKYKEEIKKGDVIGYIGESGKSKGIHLHYEIRKKGQPMDPVKFWLLYY